MRMMRMKRAMPLSSCGTAGVVGNADLDCRGGIAQQQFIAAKDATVQKVIPVVALHRRVNHGAQRGLAAQPATTDVVIHTETVLASGLVGLDGKSQQVTVVLVNVHEFKIGPDLLAFAGLKGAGSKSGEHRPSASRGSKGTRAEPPASLLVNRTRGRCGPGWVMARAATAIFDAMTSLVCLFCDHKTVSGLASVSWLALNVVSPAIPSALMFLNMAILSFW